MHALFARSRTPVYKSHFAFVVEVEHSLMFSVVCYVSGDCFIILFS